MRLTADYHTHTKYSHGKGTVLENAERAKELGLKELGITDHGFSHPVFGLRRKKLPQLMSDIAAASSRTGVKILLGIESNILGESGKVDLLPSDYPQFDLFLAGAHRFIKFDKPRDYFNFFLRNFSASLFRTRPSKALIKLTTRAYINAIKYNPIDVITHLNFLYFADAAEVAKAAADYGTYLEISAKKPHLTKDELYKVDKTGVRYVINSDAHSPEKIGGIEIAKTLLSKVDIDTNRIDNIDGRLPKFRFAEYKMRL